MPKHQKKGLQIRFEQAPGTWGEWIILPVGGGGGGGRDDKLFDRQRELMEVGDLVKAKTSNAGKVLGTDGTSLGWVSNGLPDGTTTAAIPDSADRRYVTDAQRTVITNTSGTNSGNETATTVGSLIAGATLKATPVDADSLGLSDSAATGILKKLTWANLKATLLGAATFVGTTSIALNRASANQGLTGITSTTMPGATSGSVQVIPAAVAGTGTVFTLPATTGTAITSGDTGTVTNTMLAGSIANAKLLNSSITVNGSAIALGGSATITARTPSVLTLNPGGTGAASVAFDGQASATVSYNTVGAPSTTGTNASGTWGISVTGNAGTVTSADEVADTTCFPLFATASGAQSAAPKTNTGYTFNAATGLLGSVRAQTTGTTDATSTTTGTVTTAGGMGVAKTLYCADLQVTRAFSGGQINSYVSNTSNTALSSALHSVRVAGATAGDAQYQVANTGSGQYYTMGLQNALAGDPFVFSASSTLGATNGWSVDSGGNMTITRNFATVGGYPAFECRAWVNFNGTGTVAIRAAGNVSSVSDGGVGTYVINLLTAMPDANYAVNLTMQGDTNYAALINAAPAAATPLTASTIPIQTTGAGGSNVDSATICVTVFR
jgi:hypothetical protein